MPTNFSLLTIKNNTSMTMPVDGNLYIVRGDVNYLDESTNSRNNDSFNTNQGRSFYVLFHEEHRRWFYYAASYSNSFNSRGITADQHDHENTRQSGSTSKKLIWCAFGLRLTICMYTSTRCTISCASHSRITISSRWSIIGPSHGNNSNILFKNIWRAYCSRYI